eukprot:203599-Prorocentrum_minimum.AAC.2
MGIYSQYTIQTALAPLPAAPTGKAIRATALPTERLGWDNSTSDWSIMRIDRYGARQKSAGATWQRTTSLQLVVDDAVRCRHRVRPIAHAGLLRNLGLRGGVDRSDTGSMDIFS